MREVSRRVKFRVKRQLQLLSRELSSIFKGEGDHAFDRERAFTAIYQNHAWGRDDGGFYSGVGSRGEVADGYVRELTKLLTQMKRESDGNLVVVDIGCGDFHVGKRLIDNVPGIEYIGCDIVEELVSSHNLAFAGPMVSFKKLDIVRESPPEGNVYLVRQVLQHLSNDEIAKALRHLSGKTVIVTESHPTKQAGPSNPDKITGQDVRFDWWTGIGGSVQLSLPPFNKRTSELFRLQVQANEILITEQVLP